MYHQKLLRRWAQIWMDKIKKEGRATAGEWANRTIPPDAVPGVRKELKELTSQTP